MYMRMVTEFRHTGNSRFLLGRGGPQGESWGHAWGNQQEQANTRGVSYFPAGHFRIHTLTHLN